MAITHDDFRAKQKSAAGVPYGMARDLIEYANREGIYWIADVGMLVQEQAKRIKELEAKSEELGKQNYRLINELAAAVNRADGAEGIKELERENAAAQDAVRLYAKSIKELEAIATLQDQLTNFRHANKWQAERIKTLETENECIANSCKAVTANNDALKAMCEQLAEAYLALLALGYKDTGALAKWQAMKDAAK